MSISPYEGRAIVAGVWWPRLIASDFDGTITDPDGTVPVRFRIVLARFATAGVPLVLSTGRCIGALPPVFDQLPLTVPLVGGNGAIVVDPATRTVERCWPIPAETLHTQTSRLRRRLPGVVCAVERGGEFVHEPGYPAVSSGLRPTRAVSWADLVSAPAEKLVVRWPGRVVIDPVGAVRTVVGPALTVTSSGVPGLVEMSAAGVSKATGLAWVARSMGVARAEVLAFGDMPNDLTMLRWVGRGVCVAWSDLQVKHEILARTPARSEGGVAAYLEALWRLGEADELSWHGSG